MATAIQSALEIYLHTDFQPDAEFIDGEIVAVDPCTQGQRPALYQPGATPQGLGPHNSRGLKARSIAFAQSNPKSTILA